MRRAALQRSLRIHGAVLRHHANATVSQAGGLPRDAQYTHELPDRSPFEGIAAVPMHMLRMAVDGMGLMEGSFVTVVSPVWPAGQACRITTPVDADAHGWAEFEVVPVTTGASDA